MPEAYLVFNPAAGRSSAYDDVRRIADRLGASGWNVHYREPASEADSIAIARQAAAEASDVFLIAGGDGSVESAVTGLIGSQTALGVLPFGTSNVFAQEIGVPVPGLTGRSIVDSSIAYLQQAVTRPVDLGMCNETPFLLWAGVGFDGYIVNNIEPRRRWEKKLGATYYAARAAAQVRSFKSQSLRIQLDETRIEGQYLLAVLSNIRLYAGGVATLSPHARMDDGQMELWLFSGDNLYHLLRHAGNLVVGRHITSDQVECYSVQGVVLDSDEPLHIQLDGDPFRGDQRVEFKVIHHGLNILVPWDGPEDLFCE